MQHRIGIRSVIFLSILLLVLMIVAIDLRLAIARFPEQMSITVERAIEGRRFTMQEISTTFWYELGGACLKSTVTTPRAPGESAAAWQQRHNEAVEAATAGKTLKDPPK